MKGRLISGVLPCSVVPDLWTWVPCRSPQVARRSLVALFLDSTISPVLADNFDQTKSTMRRWTPIFQWTADRTAVAPRDSHCCKVCFTGLFTRRLHGAALLQAQGASPFAGTCRASTVAKACSKRPIMPRRRNLPLLADDHCREKPATEGVGSRPRCVDILVRVLRFLSLWN
jgi:hypothetical protein